MWLRGLGCRGVARGGAAHSLPSPHRCPVTTKLSWCFFSVVFLPRVLTVCPLHPLPASSLSYGGCGPCTPPPLSDSILVGSLRRLADKTEGRPSPGERLRLLILSVSIHEPYVPLPRVLLSTRIGSFYECPPHLPGRPVSLSAEPHSTCVTSLGRIGGVKQHLPLPAFKFCESK